MAKQSTEKFVQLLTENQRRLYAYIFSLMGDHNRAADVLQESNLVLWRKVDEFDVNKPFVPWAFAIARFQVLAHLRDKKRDRCLLDEELVKTIAVAAEEQATGTEEVQIALRKCTKLLSTVNQDLLKQRYSGGKSITELSSVLGRGESAIKVALMRIREKLSTCITTEIQSSPSRDSD